MSIMKSSEYSGEYVPLSEIQNQQKKEIEEYAIFNNILPERIEN